MKTKREPRKRTTKAPAFVLRAERALRRAARKVRAENRRLGLPLIVWQKEKVPTVKA
jgi:hypothetical protein